MDILVIGCGGREHSIVMKLKESSDVKNIYVAPGNGGIEDDATCIPIDLMNVNALVQFAEENSIDLTIVGPEVTLELGIANAFHEKGLPIFAPTKEASLLEASKDFAKQFMLKYEIPTADYKTFSDSEAAKEYIADKGAPIVIKADGLAEGKGVVVAETTEQAQKAVDKLMVDGAFNGAGKKLVIEEFLEGREFSYIAFVHENNVYPMITARDHKRAYDDDKGPNTGGMGVFAPVPDITKEIEEFATTHILQKVADGMLKEGRSFTGILYAGLIQTSNGTKVIEFNTRFGDPETQVILPLLKNDFVQVITDVMEGKNPNLEWRKESSVGIVVASRGYPKQYETGKLLPEIYCAFDKNVYNFHACTTKTSEGYMSNGGRVLLVGGIDKNLQNAADKAYDCLKSFDDNDNFYYRTDIGKY